MRLILVVYLSMLLVSCSEQPVDRSEDAGNAPSTDRTGR